MGIGQRTEQWVRIRERVHPEIQVRRVVVGHDQAIARLVMSEVLERGDFVGPDEAPLSVERLQELSTHASRVRERDSPPEPKHEDHTDREQPGGPALLDRADGLARQRHRHRGEHRDEVDEVECDPFRLAVPGQREEVAERSVRHRREHGEVDEAGRGDGPGREAAPPEHQADPDRREERQPSSRGREDGNGERLDQRGVEWNHPDRDDRGALGRAPAEAGQHGKRQRECDETDDGELLRWRDQPADRPEHPRVLDHEQSSEQHQHQYHAHVDAEQRGDEQAVEEERAAGPRRGDRSQEQDEQDGEHRHADDHRDAAPDERLVGERGEQLAQYRCEPGSEREIWHQPPGQGEETEWQYQRGEEQHDSSEQGGRARAREARGFGERRVIASG